MAKANDGWISTARNDHLQEYWSSNAVKRTVYQKKVDQNPSNLS